MTDASPLDLQDVMHLVADATQVAMLGGAPVSGAREIVGLRNPSVRLVAAARRENLEIHSGTTPESLRDYLPATPVPDDLVRLRRLVDDVLGEVERIVSEKTGH